MLLLLVVVVVVAAVVVSSTSSSPIRCFPLSCYSLSAPYQGIKFCFAGTEADWPILIRIRDEQEPESLNQCLCLRQIDANPSCTI